MSGRTARRRITKIRLPGPGAEPTVSERPDLLAAEEPLGIRVDGEAVTLTMRTPGDDIDLAAGFLFSEGIIKNQADLAEIRLCDGTTCGHAGHDGLGNIVDVRLRGASAASRAPRRNFMTTSACGVCGKASAAELFVQQIWGLKEDKATISPALLATFPGALRDAQRVFASTGGLHAAGVFGPEGELACLREDVGRHNAVDKVVGWALRSGRLPMRGQVLLVSGRASFELVQKAVLAGFPVLAAVSAPSSLAADLAEQTGLTLVGFLRGGSMNVYAGAERVTDRAARS
ncbi:MAG TPA: formate dehydrogenase accessory sulfurtransferase FdhD [Streptosporangiaceae bacterium]|nr:formate dehydrogenase accessory sulfurtransferase FdhD [Streptosporangiaceae bacterium]